MPWDSPIDLCGPLHHWLTDDTYFMGDCDYSVTQLLAPVQLTVLRKLWGTQGDDSLVRDPASLLASRIGTAIHNDIHAAWKRNHLGGIAEERHYFDLAGARIGFTPDWIDPTGHVHDWKSTKIWGVLDGPKDDWRWQLPAYAYGLAQNGMKITRLTAWAIILDHSPAKVEELPYPIVPFDIPMRPMEEVEAYLTERLDLLRAAEAAVASGDLLAIPPCSPDERWAKPGRWAVCKRGNKRALALRDTQAEAQEILDAGWKKATHLEERPGKPWYRCHTYCPIGKNNRCPQAPAKEN